MRAQEHHLSGFTAGLSAYLCVVDAHGVTAPQLPGLRSGQQLALPRAVATSRC